MNSSDPETVEFAAFAGIDWADEKHDICLKPADSQKLEFRVLPHSPQSIDEWARDLRRRFSGRPIAVCLEQKKGPLIYALLKYDFLILYPVNPQTLARYRQAFATSHAKDDPTDAALQVELLTCHRDQLSPWRPDIPEVRQLQQLVIQRRRLVNDKVRLSNRLTSTLKDYFPQALELFEEIDTTIACEFLIRWPTLAKARRAHKTTLGRFFRAHNARSQKLIESRIATLRKAMPLTKDPAIVEPGSLMAVALATQIIGLIASIHTYQKAIESLCARLVDYPLFAALPGAGPVFAPRLMAAFGTDRERYQSADDLQKYAGIAPVTERSGKSSWVHWRYACPIFLRQSFIEWAGQSIHHSFWAGGYQRDFGKSHHAALRALSFKWIRILFRCWKERKPYDESIYLSSLKKRNSPLLKYIAESA